jgi:CheY-like chemotaxis protein
MGASGPDERPPTTPPRDRSDEGGSAAGVDARLVSILRDAVVDLRGRLRTVAVVTDVLSSTPLDDAQSEQLAAIRASVSSAVALADEAIAMGGATAGATGGAVRSERIPIDLDSDIPGTERTGTTDEGAADVVRVLVVEDNDVNCKVAQAMLGRFGYDVTIARDGAAGVDAALSGDFHVVLMDCRMPGLDGFAATRRLRDAGYRRPIVALTAQVLSGDRERCLEVGMDGYLAKPIDMEELRRTIDRHVRDAGA